MNKTIISILWIILISSYCFAQETAPNQIKLNLIATDKSNVLIDDLLKEEITLLIDGKPQTISTLETQELPLIYALAVDCSGSMRLVLDDLVKSSKALVNQNRAADETFLLSFVSSDKIRSAKNFSTDKNVLNATIDNFYIEGGLTAVIDAVYLAVQKTAEYKRDDGKIYRRAVVVITDGEDRDSFYTESKLTDLIAKENIQIFFIDLSSNLEGIGVYGKSPKDKALDLMKRIAAKSGGAVITPKKKALTETATALSSLIRTQYTLSYSPPVNAKNTSRKVEIKLAKDSKRKDVRFYFRQND